jgi:predicted phage terminase large subunit-like protein
MIAEDIIAPGDPRQPGEPLWPERFGNLDDHERIKIGCGLYDWNSLYQQHPSVAGGLIFSREWWGSPDSETRDQFYKKHPLEMGDDMEQLIQSWDCTFKDLASSDYVVGQVWGKRGSERFLLDQVRGKMGVIATMQSIRTLSGKWPKATAKLIEDKANGTAVVEMLRKEIPGMIPVEPHGGKAVRAQAAVPYIEAGNVFLPVPEHAPWIHEFIEELAEFPSGKHDDQVDSFSQAMSYMQGKQAKIIVPTKMPMKQPVRSPGGWSNLYVGSSSGRKR